MPDVFLSYSHKDIEHVQAVASALEHKGWEVFWDKHLHGGQSYDQVLAAALDDAAAVVVLWSENSAISDWVRDEAEHAKSRGVLVPIIIDPIRIPLGFGRIHTLDFTSWDGEADSEEVEDLDRALRSVTTAQTAAAPVAPMAPVTDSTPNAAPDDTLGLASPSTEAEVAVDNDAEDRPVRTISTKPAVAAEEPLKSDPPRFGAPVFIGVLAIALAGFVFALTRGNGETAVETTPEITASVTSTTLKATTTSTEPPPEEPPAAPPIRATVDAGTVVGINKTNPVIGSSLVPTLNPPEYAPIRQLDERVIAFIDINNTTNRQFYDFATFASTAVDGTADQIWAGLVPRDWLATNPSVPTDFDALGIDPREPVSGISADAASSFCSYALKRMPTEIEWELAARDGKIETDAVQNWVAAPQSYGPTPDGIPVLRGSFGTQALPVYFRTIGDTPSNRINAGVRCAADDVIEIARPTGDLLYAREFSDADGAHDWPDFHREELKEVTFGYHAPAVFHIEARGARTVAVGSGETHPNNVEISALVELRTPKEPDGGFRHGLVANAGADGYVSLTVTDRLAADGSRSVRWCATDGNQGLFTAENREFIALSPETLPECQLGGIVPVDGFQFTIGIEIADGEAQFTIADKAVGSFAATHRRNASFGFIVENDDDSVTTHIHFDNLAVATS